MKKTILVPTDFSANGAAAVNYAIGMAEKYDFGVHLVHVYSPLTTRFGDDGFNSQMTTHAKEQAETEMDKLLVGLTASHPDVPIIAECIEHTSLTDALASISGKASHQLIVMGTRGASGLKQILGSNTYQAIIKSPLPVLAIPENYDSFHLKNAGLLSNFRKSDIPLLETFLSIFGKSIQITLLHVRETNSPQEDAQLIQWKSHLEEVTGLTEIGTKTTTVSKRLDVDEDIPQCIHDMAEEEKLEALLITYTTRSFFQRVFSRNLVKNIAHQIHRPVFFYREQ